MKYDIIFSKQAKKEIAILRKSDTASFIKLQKLLYELMEHPYFGTGKPERMINDYSGYYSRRIGKKYRLVYIIDDDKVIVEITQVRGHYKDK